MKELLAAVILLGSALLAMSVTILFKKNGKFPQSDIGANEALLDKGLSCVKDDSDKIFGDKQHSLGMCSPDSSDACSNCGVVNTGK